MENEKKTSPTNEELIEGLKKRDRKITNLFIVGKFYDDAFFRLKQDYRTAHERDIKSCIHDGLLALLKAIDKANSTVESPKKYFWVCCKNIASKTLAKKTPESPRKIDINEQFIDSPVDTSDSENSQETKEFGKRFSRLVDLLLKSEYSRIRVKLRLLEGYDYEEIVLELHPHLFEPPDTEKKQDEIKKKNNAARNLVKSFLDRIKGNNDYLNFLKP